MTSSSRPRGLGLPQRKQYIMVTISFLYFLIKHLFGFIHVLERQLQENSSVYWLWSVTAKNRSMAGSIWKKYSFLKNSNAWDNYSLIRDRKMERNQQSISLRLTGGHTSRGGYFECDTGLGGTIKLWWWLLPNINTSILLVSRGLRRGRAWNRLKLARFGILFKLPTTSQPCWKHQASEPGESVFEDRSRLNLEILTQPPVKFSNFLLKLWVTFGFHSSSDTEGKGRVDGLHIFEWRSYNWESEVNSSA